MYVPENRTSILLLHLIRDWNADYFHEVAHRHGPLVIQV